VVVDALTPALENGRIMRLWKFVSDWLKRRRRHLQADLTAVRHFEKTTGNRSHWSMCCVLGEDERGSVVRVCYGRSKPPRRAWYAVNDSSVVTLTFDDAARFW
jgi:hypothetical protein